MRRRQFLGLAGLIALPLKLFANDLQKTPDDVEGPFYPVDAIPIRSQLIIDPKTLKDGIMQLQGKVLTSTGKPLIGAKVEIWQCDSKGFYDHPYSTERHNFDKRFAGFGAQLSDSQGRYSFNTLYPVPYTGRPPHIHVKIWHNNRELLTTQLYLKGGTGGFWSRAKREALQIIPMQDQNKRFNAEFTFIV